MIKKSTKRLLALILALLTVLACAAIPASAASDIKVSVNGSSVTFNDDLGFPYIDGNGRTMVPFRAVANFMDGVKVNWFGEGKIAEFKKFVPFNNKDSKVAYIGVSVYFPIGTDQAWLWVTNYRVNGSIYSRYSRLVQMDTQSTVRNGRTYAPIRYLAESLCYTVGWNNSTQTVTLTSPKGDWAAAFVQAEYKKGFNDIVSNNDQARQYANFYARWYGDMNPDLTDLGEDVMQDGTHIWRFKDNDYDEYLYITQYGKTFYSEDGGKTYEQF